MLGVKVWKSNTSNIWKAVIGRSDCGDYAIYHVLCEGWDSVKKLLKVALQNIIETKSLLNVTCSRRQFKHSCHARGSIRGQFMKHV